MILSVTSIADVLCDGSTYSPQFPLLTSTHNLSFFSSFAVLTWPGCLFFFLLLQRASGVWRRFVVNLTADLKNSQNQQ